MNPTVINSRMFSVNSFTRTLAPGHLITQLRIADHEDLLVSSDDLSEFYYTFKVSLARATRNSIGLTFRGRDFVGMKCYEPSLHDCEVLISLATLAMGDSLAVEIAQQSHFNLLRVEAGCLRESETLQYRKPVPRGPFVEMLTIDDHVGLQKVDKRLAVSNQRTRDTLVFRRSGSAYLKVGLTAHPGKRQRQVPSATVLGARAGVCTS